MKIYFFFLLGLINGPMFRRFSYRQVGLFGAFLVAFAIFTTSISNSFLMYLLTFSVLYGKLLFLLNKFSIELTGFQSN